MDQLLSAISIVSNPALNRELQPQAIQFLNSVRQNPSESWQLALKLFIDTKPDGSRANDPQVRLFALQILDDFFDGHTDPYDSESFRTLEQTFNTYIQQEYIYGPAESSASFIRNKFSHTLALLFLSTYPDQWPDFFTSMFQHLRSSNASNSSQFNSHVSTLFLRLLIEISGEVADSLLKNARVFQEARHQRDGAIKDAIRVREAQNIVEAVLAIISDGERQLVAARNGSRTGVDINALIDTVSLGTRTFASLIHWIDINLTVTPDTLGLMFRLLSDPAPTIRIETSNAFLRIVTKGLKTPADKIQLFQVLSLGDVLPNLEEKTRDGGDDASAYRECLGKLSDALGSELVKLSEEASLSNELQNIVQRFLQQIFPVILRFLADEFDDTSVTVHPFLSLILGQYKRAKKQAPAAPLTDSKRGFLSSLLEVVLQKMKWDRDADDDLIDEDEKLGFDNMRKDLKGFLDSVYNVDEQLVNNYVQTLVMNTLQAHQRGTNISWQDAELAVHLIYLFGELQKGVKGKGTFVQLPPALKVATAEKRPVDYSGLPLTPHGEMMVALVQSNISAYPHPMVLMQFFEAVGRYGEFFKVRKECGDPVLASFVDQRGIHNPKTELRGRIFYLFHRFIKEIRTEIQPALVPTILNTLGDLLVIQPELPDLDSPSTDILSDAVNTPGLFDNQLYLFETVGTLLSLMKDSPGDQASLLQVVVNPLLSELSQALQVQMMGPQDVLPVLKVHHLIRALGNISKGFPDAPSPTPPGYVSPPWVSVFDQVAEGILVSLGAMNGYKIVREATRFAFARIVASAGAATTKYIPTLMGRLLSHFEMTELVEFIGFLGLVIHRLQMEVYDVLDELIIPLNTHLANVLSQPIDGTDAKQANFQAKKAYLELLVAIMTGRLYPVFVSSRNKSQLEPLIQFVMQVASDPSDPPSQRVAWTLLARFTTHFGRSPEQEPVVNARGETVSTITIPGYETLIYERLIPMAFDVPSLPSFNLKDGQTLNTLAEMGVCLAATRKARGQEVLDFFGNVFLPSKNCPPDVTANFVNNLRDLDSRGFKSFWTNFVRSSP